MPMYDYKCPSCEREFELLTSKRGSEADLADCPVCGAKAERQMSVPAGIVVKGSDTPVRRHTRRTPPSTQRRARTTQVGATKGMDTSKLPWVDRQGNLREAGTGKVLRSADGKGE